MNNNDQIKTLWTNKDFEQMGWHDCKIHAIAFGMSKYEIAFDIDYILSWIQPNKGNNSLRFLVSPATLIFKNVYDMDFNIPSTDIEIDSIERINPKHPKNVEFINGDFEYDWILTTSNGEITFKSVGFTQYIRKRGILKKIQALTLKERGGISFETALDK